MLQDIPRSGWAAVVLAVLLLLIALPWIFGGANRRSSKVCHRIGIGIAIPLLLIGGMAVLAFIEPHAVRDPLALIFGAICFGFSNLGIAIGIWYLLLVFLRRKPASDAVDGWQRQFTISQLLGITFLLGALFGVGRLVYDFPQQSRAMVLLLLGLVSMTTLAGLIVNVLIMDSDPPDRRMRSKKITLPLNAKRPPEREEAEEER